MRGLNKRLVALEDNAAVGRENWFLWLAGVPLAEALASRGLTLEDRPVRAIEIVFVKPGPAGPLSIPDPVHDRDRHLLECAG